MLGEWQDFEEVANQPGSSIKQVLVFRQSRMFIGEGYGHPQVGSPYF